MCSWCHGAHPQSAPVRDRGSESPSGKMILARQGPEGRGRRGLTFLLADRTKISYVTRLMTGNEFLRRITRLGRTRGVRSAPTQAPARAATAPCATADAGRR